MGASLGRIVRVGRAARFHVARIARRDLGRRRPGAAPRADAGPAPDRLPEQLVIDRVGGSLAYILVVEDVVVAVGLEDVETDHVGVGLACYGGADPLRLL